MDQAAGLKAGMSKADADQAIDGFLQRLFAGTRLGDREFRLGLLEKSTADLVATKDPFILLAAAMEPLAEANREAAKNRGGAQARLMPRYMEALLAKAGGLVAPDANSTLRVTYGQVKGVDAKDGLYYKPQTTLAGIVEKHTGEGDFDAPKVQLDAIKALQSGKKTPYLDAALRDVPVNFLSTVDTTGGNSGSPTLNGKGELVGLLFDGTYESVASNYLFDPVDHALDSCGQPVHAVEYGRGGRRGQSAAGDGDLRVRRGAPLVHAEVPEFDRDTAAPEKFGVSAPSGG